MEPSPLDVMAIVCIPLGSCTKIVARLADNGLASCIIDGPAPDLDSNSIDELPLSCIPLYQYCPRAEPYFESANALQEGQTIKLPRIEDWIEPADWPKWVHLSEREVRMYELLKQHPHPNIGRYFGCVIEEGMVTGLCVEKGTATLTEKLSGATIQQKTAYYNGIEEGLIHLHQLGLSHNSLLYVDIRMRGDVPFITNFAYCTRGARWERLPNGTLVSEAKHSEMDLEKLNDLKKYILWT